MTAAQSTEIKLRRKQLGIYIAADPVTVSFVRYPQVPDGAGGWVKGPALNVAPQIMRLVPYKRRLSALTQLVTPGDIPNVQYSLVGPYNADVERYDEFQMNGEWMKVIGVEPKSRIPDMSDRLTILIEIRDQAQ